MEAGLITLIGGVANVGKSPLLLAMVAGYLKGVWPDGTAVPEWFAGRNVVYYLPEGFASQMRFLRDWGLDDATLRRVKVPSFEGPGDDPKPDFAFSLDGEGLAMLREACETHKPALIVIDGLRSAMEGDESFSSDSKAFFAPLTRLAHQHEAALVMTHHLRKGSEFLSRSGEMPTMDWFRGSGDLLRPCRSAWIVDQPNPHDLGGRRITLVKAAEGPKPMYLNFRMAAPSDGLQFGERAPQATPLSKKEMARQLIVEALEAGRLSYDSLVQVAAESGISEHTLRMARETLARDNAIQQVVEGKHQRFWQLVDKEELLRLFK
jgi:hypothetical protein